ncbi:kinase-like protein [Whalleya microplaca]|nr:kinase-like protein [Whalleya microplaca]
MPQASASNSIGDGHPLRSALKQDDDGDKPPLLSTTSSTKAVQIAEPDQITPEEAHPKRQYSAGLAKRLSGRPAIPDANSSRTSIISQSSLEAAHSGASSQSPLQIPQDGSHSHHSHQHQHHHRVDRFVAQIADWLEHERVKQGNRKSRRVHSTRRRSVKDDTDRSETQQPERARKYSIDSQSSDVSLDRLQKIIDDSMSSLGLGGIPHYNPRRRSQRRRSVNLHRTASSDTEYFDGDVRVPGCDAVLDNTKALGYSGGQAVTADDTTSFSSKKEDKERRSWVTFKNDIIRLTHTLRLKGWRRVPLDSGEDIDVTRLSGALTNAVYVVSPPGNVKSEEGKKTPSKLLLRVYGPQVENIIDRENELSVLRRLSRKKIGPRLLGTFTNGRFEQYLNAVTLTAADLRDPDTSKQIAKRMRELHDGIELLDKERDGGPAVLKNWDNWLDMVSGAIKFLDKRILSGDLGPVKSAADAWKKRGLICGVEWASFKAMVDKYRRFLLENYGSPEAIREQLVFAHSDTQYGNILRLQPDDKKSPLLQPNYEHKQLVVIDFEYSAANTRGLEFANHFTEWCYNYHNENAPFACDTAMYPTAEEQHRFIKAYVNHQPQFPHPSASTPNLTPFASPTIAPTQPQPQLERSSSATTPSGLSSSIKEFMLDSRAPPGGWREEDKRQEEQVDRQVEALMEETRIWRIANSAQWIAWGILQAKIPGYDDGNEDSDDDTETAVAAPEEEEGEGDGDGDEGEFDYLAYAQDRAMFFWADCVKMGLAKMEDFPEEMRGKLKFVDE